MFLTFNANVRPASSVQRTAPIEIPAAKKQADLQVGSAASSNAMSVANSPSQQAMAPPAPRLPAAPASTLWGLTVQPEKSAQQRNGQMFALDALFNS